MKYLMLFEAFESGVISKITKFVKKKIGRDSIDKFLADLRTIKDKIDFPIDKISDNDVEYLSSRAAIKIDKKDREEFDDNTSLYCLKFWFSLEKGYIGFSGVGDYLKEFEKSGRGFNESDFDFIKDYIIKTGSLRQIKGVGEYEALRTGDDVIASLGGNRNEITKGKIFRDGEQIYFIHNNPECDGSNPQYQYTSRGEAGDWREFGRLSWSMGRPNSLGDDWKNLYRYTPSEEELKIIGEDLTKKSVFDFNLPIVPRNNQLKLVDWSRYKEDDWSLSRYNNEEKHGWEKIEDSDFCIIFYLENLEVEQGQRPSEVKSKRKESKEGALSLMNDEQIRKANIDRYLSIILSNMGIGKESLDFKNLQKIILSFLGSDYILFSIYNSRPSIGNITEFSKNLTRLISNYNNLKKSEVDSDKNYFRDHMIEEHSNLLRRYSAYKNDSTKYRNMFVDNYKVLLNDIKNSDITLEESKPIKEFFNKFKSLEEYINTKINNNEIKTMEDLFLLENKLRSIKNVFDNDLFRFKSDVKYILDDFRFRMSDGDFKSYVKDMASLSSDAQKLKDDIKKLDKIEEYIKSILG